MRIQDWDKLNLDMINTINDNDVEDVDSDNESERSLGMLFPPLVGFYCT